MSPNLDESGSPACPFVTVQHFWGGVWCKVLRVKKEVPSVGGVGFAEVWTSKGSQVFWMLRMLATVCISLFGLTILAVPRAKVDGFVPGAQNVNLRIVRAPK